MSLLPLSAHLPGSDVGDCNAVPAGSRTAPSSSVKSTSAWRSASATASGPSVGWPGGRSRSRESAHRGSGVLEGGEGLDVVVFARLEAGRARTRTTVPTARRYRSTAPRSPSPVTSSEPPILPPPIRRASSTSGAKDRAPTTPARQPRNVALPLCATERASPRLLRPRTCDSGSSARPPPRGSASGPRLGSSCGCRGGSPVLPC